jgi:hypothetical protein
MANKNKISALLGVGLIGALTFTPILNTQASITPPIDYDFNYRFNSTTGYFAIGGTTLGSVHPGYTLTTDSNGDYLTTSITSATSSFVPFGVEITIQLFEPTTTFALLGGNYFPTSSTLGTNSVNNINDIFLPHVVVSIENESNNDYLFSFDFTDGSNDYYFEKFTRNNDIYNINQNYIYNPLNNDFIYSYVSSYSDYEITTWNTGDKFLSSIYGLDLGTNPAFYYGQEIAYDDGYADGLGNNPNILLNGFQAMVGILVNFSLMILNLEVFGVSLMGIFSIVILFTGIVWVLKLIRG